MEHKNKLGLRPFHYERYYAEIRISMWRHYTSAPNSVSVSISTAVCTVMWRHPAILAPFNVFNGPYFSRIDINPGISFSAIMISLRPVSWRLMSAVEQRKFAFKTCFHRNSIFWEKFDMIPDDFTIQQQLYLPTLKFGFDMFSWEWQNDWR